MDEPLTTLIVDDHAVVRKGLRALLTTVPQVAVVGEAANGAQAVRMAAELRPTLVLMDLQMPGGSGLSAVRQIAVQLDLSAKTIRNYISSIFSKLQVADRAEAIIKARDAGMGG